MQVSDAGIEALAAGCRAIASLSLNNIPGLGDLALVALRQSCATSLTTLDVSWCRGVTDLVRGHALAHARTPPHESLRGALMLRSPAPIRTAAPRHDASAASHAPRTDLRPHPGFLFRPARSRLASYRAQGLGSLVDAAPHLQKLSIWGCSQLTKLFFDGHKNDALRIVGRCYA